MGAGAGGVNFALARYNPDGTLDGSFGIGGIVTTAVAPGDNFDTASSVAIDPAGKIVAGGDAESGGFPLRPGHSSATTPTDRSTTPSGRAAR